MMETPLAPPLSTFVVRLWRERTAGGGQWRGRIEHLESGEGTAFLTWQQMVAFAQRFGIMVEIGELEPVALERPGAEDETDVRD